MSIADLMSKQAMQLAQVAFPEGNFQSIKANAPSQMSYNIDATRDLVQNQPFNPFAPGLAFGLSLPYDTVQGIGRAFKGFEPQTGILDYDDIPDAPTFAEIGKSIAAENPLDSLVGRTYGATLGLADKLSSAGPGLTGTSYLDDVNISQAPGTDVGSVGKTLSGFAKSVGDLFSGSAIASEADVAKAIAEREALNREGLMAMDDAGLTISPYEQFAQVAKPGFNLDFAKQLGKQALTGILTKLDPITGALVKGASFLKESPEQKAVSDLYDLDDTGTVRSGIMAGYNPSSVFGPVGLTKSMLSRIDTINKNKVISKVLEKRKEELKAKIAAEQKALQDFNRANQTGGYQSDFSQDTGFMEGRGTAAEMGST